MSLLPCPFCGEHPQAREGKSLRRENPRIFVVAHDCPTLGCSFHTGWRDTPEDAEKRWNTRFIPAIPEPSAPIPLETPAQHFPCESCPFDPNECGGCERLHRYDAARAVTP